MAYIAGDGIGLYKIYDDMTMRLHPESVTGTFANRMVHCYATAYFMYH